MRVTSKCVFGILAIVALYSSPAFGQTFTTVFNVPPDTAPSSIGANTQLNVNNGGVVGTFGSFFSMGGLGVNSNSQLNVSLGGEVKSDFNSHSGSSVNIDGGVFSDEGGPFGPFLGEFSAFESVVNISGGRIERAVIGFFDSSVNISGGLLLSATFDEGSQVEMSGGSIENSTGVFDNSVMNMSGGSRVDRLSVDLGSTLNMSGGRVSRFGPLNIGTNSKANISGGEVRAGFRVIGTGTVNIMGGEISGRVRAEAGSTLNLMVRELVLDGQTVSLVAEQPFVISERAGKQLEAVLADGTHYSVTLNETLMASQDYIDVGATLTVTSVIPEPTTIVLLCSAFLLFGVTRRC